MNKKKEHSITGSLEDLYNNPVLIALGKVAAKFYHTGTLSRKMDGNDFAGTFFKAGCLGDRRPKVLASDLVKMAAESVKAGKLILKLEDKNYTGFDYVALLVKVLVKSIEDAKDLLSTKEAVSAASRPTVCKNMSSGAAPAH